MHVSANIAFKQGSTVGSAGFALLGVLTTPVTVSNGNDTNVQIWTYEVIDVPPGSAVPVGVVSSGIIPTYQFTPDKTGGYLIHLRTTDNQGNYADDFRVFQVPEASGRIIPPFRATDKALNLTIASVLNLRGWAPFQETYDRYVDGLSGIVSIKDFVLTAGVQTVAVLATFTRIGSRIIDFSPFPATIGALNRHVQFIADIDKTAGATSVEVQLYDLTDSVAITGTDMTATSLANTEVNSGDLTVGSSAGNIRNDSPKNYVAQLKMNGGVVGTDAVFCTNARVVVFYS